MVLALGNIFRKYDMELFETTERKIEIVRDCYVLLTRDGSKGVRVALIRAKEKEL
jgi:hypothetical protein